MKNGGQKQLDFAAESFEWTPDPLNPGKWVGEYFLYPLQQDLPLISYRLNLRSIRTKTEIIFDFSHKEFHLDENHYIFIPEHSKVVTRIVMKMKRV